MIPAVAAVIIGRRGVAVAVGRIAVAIAIRGVTVGRIVIRVSRPPQRRANQRTDGECAEPPSPTPTPAGFRRFRRAHGHCAGEQKGDQRWYNGFTSLVPCIFSRSVGACCTIITPSACCSSPENNAAEAAQSEREVNSADDRRGQNLRPYD